MSLQYIYSCNICKEEIDDVNNLFGVNFASGKKFTLGAYGSTKGQHICYDCARHLAGILENDNIKDILKI